jgi:hypothetical protein
MDKFIYWNMSYVLNFESLRYKRIQDLFREINGNFKIELEVNGGKKTKLKKHNRTKKEKEEKREEKKRALLQKENDELTMEMIEELDNAFRVVDYLSDCVQEVDITLPNFIFVIEKVNKLIPKIPHKPYCKDEDDPPEGRCIINTEFRIDENTHIRIIAITKKEIANRERSKQK